MKWIDEFVVFSLGNRNHRSDLDGDSLTSYVFSSVLYSIVTDMVGTVSFR